MTICNDQDVIYAAGYFEADGAATIYRLQKCSRWLRVRVSVTSVDRETVEWFKSRFGGCIVTRRRPSPKSKVPYRWVSTGESAVTFLRMIRPHMKLYRKQQVADLCIEFRDIALDQPLMRKLGQKDPEFLDRYVAYRLMYKSSVNALNKSGREVVKA